MQETMNENPDGPEKVIVLSYGNGALLVELDNAEEFLSESLARVRALKQIPDEEFSNTGGKIMNIEDFLDGSKSMNPFSTLPEGLDQGLFSQKIPASMLYESIEKSCKQDGVLDENGNIPQFADEPSSISESMKKFLDRLKVLSDEGKTLTIVETLDILKETHATIDVTKVKELQKLLLAMDTQESPAMSLDKPYNLESVIKASNDIRERYNKIMDGIQLEALRESFEKEAVEVVRKDGLEGLKLLLDQWEHTGSNSD